MQQPNKYYSLKLPAVVEELGSFGGYETFSEDTFSFEEALELLRDEKED
ncbi:MAG: hypothetical protein IIA49_03670 [Bacteroidetes bacterium]|nr:hypothetical protein [Bacteroidota bacterium]MCH7770102.1 hypothetical protein [Bacteroidota bacterium]